MRQRDALQRLRRSKRPAAILRLTGYSLAYLAVSSFAAVFTAVALSLATGTPLRHLTQYVGAFLLFQLLVATAFLFTPKPPLSK